LLLITENISSNTKVLLSMSDPILSFMLPVLLSKIKSDSADIRFLSLKIFTDIIIQYLHDESIYDLKGGSDLQVNADGNSVKVSSKQINDLILKNLFPSFSIILADNDPVPLFGLKLLSAIIERNPGFVPLLK
jgi:serine/threonine-protein kinase ULK4